jgi:hypothetical protein
MFDWPLFFLIVAVAIPGILVSMPRLLETQLAILKDRVPAGKELPSRSMLTIVLTVQTLVLVAGSAAIGVALAPRVGLGAPFFEAILTGGPVGAVLAQLLIPSLVVSIGGALIFFAAYYLLVRPNLDGQTVQVMEGLRMKLGLWSRILYGGIVEEIISRWGLMTLFVWLGALLVGQPTAAVIWVAIVVSGVIFGLLHAPSYLGAGCKSTPLFWGAMIGLNLWASLIFGWLFWQYGLFAAMLSHMFFHLIWLPFDVRYAGGEPVLRSQ